MTSPPTVEFRSVEPLTKPEVAEIVETPAPAAVASPVGVITATEVTDEPHTTDAVTSLVVLSV